MRPKSPRVSASATLGRVLPQALTADAASAAHPTRRASTASATQEAPQDVPDPRGGSGLAGRRERASARARCERLTKRPSARHGSMARRCRGRHDPHPRGEPYKPSVSAPTSRR